MKARISELMDGELEGADAGALLAALRDEGETREAWRTYHLIGDTLRDTRALAPDFAARVAARVAGEPTVLAPAVPGSARRRPLRVAAGIAAGVAAVALVGSLVYGPQPAQQAPAQVAQSPAPVASHADPVRVPPPAATDDYLLAHQRYSPRHSLQGVAPYVRTVSGEAGARRP